MSAQQSPIISQGRNMMKVYAARDYLDITSRHDTYVQVNVPEYLPTVPQDDKYTSITISPDYFANKNFPVTANVIKSVHYLTLPLLTGVRTPVRFNKGAEFLLIFPTGKVEEGYLVFIKDKEKDEDKNKKKEGAK